MRIIRFIIVKEFIQIFRNPLLVLIILSQPFIQVLLLGTAGGDINYASVYVVDEDLSSTSREIISKMEGSDFFDIRGAALTMDEAFKVMEYKNINLIVHFPPNFEKKLIKEHSSKVQLVTNAIDAITASLTYAYSSEIIGAVNKDVAIKWGTKSLTNKAATVSIPYSYWYNRALISQYIMVPAMCVAMVVMITILLSAMNIVKEKEIGTMEQLNVTPMRKTHFIMGKIIPVWIINIVLLGIGLILSRLVFHVPVVGSLWLVFFLSGVVMFLLLAVGVLISVVSNTQQQAMFFTFFIIMIFVIFGDFITPIDNMPSWGKAMAELNPQAYYSRMIHLVITKGSGLRDILPDLLKVSGLTVATLALSLYIFNKKD